jgi:hypothetical protein
MGHRHSGIAAPSDQQAWIETQCGAFSPDVRQRTFSPNDIEEMIRMNKILIFLALAGLAALLPSCASPAQPGETTYDSVPAAPSLAVDQNTQIEEAIPSWARTYDLDSLVREADLIAEVSILGIKETRNVGGSPYTDYKADISRVIKGPTGFADPSIILIQHGGTLQGKTVVTKEDGLFNIGAKLLLFLRDMSNNPVHSPNREKKFMTLMPGGRFQIKPDGKLDTPTTRLAVADNYRGRDKSALEKDIQAKMPTLPDYLQSAVRASFLIVEGRVTSLLETRLVSAEATAEEMAQAKARSELAGSVYTFYNFTVDRVLEDKIARYKGDPHKPPKYNRPPVAEGQVITVLEMGGTYQGITQRRTWSQFLQPGSKMLLFLNAIACDSGIVACNKSEQETHRLFYLLEDNSDRFTIGSDSRLSAVTQGPISRSYHAQAKEKLETDIATEKGKLDKALADTKSVPLPTVPANRLPPTPTPRR